MNHALKRKVMKDDEAFIKSLIEENTVLAGKLDTISKMLGDEKLLTQEGSALLVTILKGATKDEK